MTSVMGISHIIKSKQRLLSNTQRVNSKRIHNWCYEKLDQDPIASVVIAAIYCGRSYDKIVEQAERVRYEKNDHVYYCIKFKTSWDYRDKLKSVISPSLPENYNKDMCIHLPDYLYEGIYTLKQSKGSLKEMADDLLKPLRSECLQVITEEQIRSSLSFQRFAFDISDAELTFISNSNLDDCVNAQYGQMNNQSIQQKLDKYIGGFHSAPHSLACKVIYKEKVFGSYYTPTFKQVETLLKSLEQLVKELPSNIEECRSHFNAVTVYIVLVMQLSTMHRPIDKFDIPRSQFDLQVDTMFLKDKSGSHRVVPIPKVFSSLIQQYCRFINQHIIFMQATKNNSIDQLHKALNSKSSLFLHYNERGKLVVLQTSVIDVMLKAHNLKNNWARHFVCSILAREGVNRDVIARYMGQSCESGLHYKFLSSSFNDLRAISSILDNQIVDVLQLATLDFFA